MSNKRETIVLTPAQVTEHMNQYIKNCQYQISRDIIPTSLCIEGPAGISKTSIVKKIAKDHGYKLHQINAAMIDDLGHLIGFPKKEYKVILNENGIMNEKWLPLEVISSLPHATMTGEDRMSYAEPYWLKEIGPDEKFILLLDDFTRGLPMVMQACMTLVEEYKYGSWVLPKNTIIVLTTNPDNGEYSVTGLDLAQKTRFRTLSMRFDVTSWAQWAESQDLDGRCINFVLNNPELFSNRHDGIGGGVEFNARIMTKFFNDIGCLDDFTQSLSYVKVCGDGSVGSAFTDHFITFVNNKMDKLPSPKELLKMKSEDAKKALTAVCGNFESKTAYNPAVASIMANRLVNYVIFGTHDKWGRDENQKVIDMILHNSFSQDLKFVMARQFATPQAKAQSSKFELIFLNPQFMNMILDRK